MIEHVATVGYGRPATTALAAAVARAKGERPLAPVTVVVPSNLAGLAARRTLAAGLDGPGRGLVNVSFVTVLRLAQLLAAAAPSAEPPLTNPVLASAVRRALARDPRPFGEVAQHVATERAVVATYADLSRLSPEALQAVRATEQGALAVDLFQRVHALLGDYADEDQMVRAVLEPTMSGAADELGYVVWYLPERLSPARTALMRALLERRPSTVIAALVGEEQADEAVRGLCRAAGGGELGQAPPPAAASRIVTVADAEQEVAEAMRSIVALLADGVPVDRIGIFYPVTDPYVRIVEAQSAASGVPVSGPSPERLADCIAARCLLAALALPDERWRRDKVMALIADAPVRHGGRLASPAAWERISRQAGVVRDLAQWQRNLATFITQATARADDPASAQSAAHHRSDAEAAAQLAAFVTALAGAVVAVHQAPTWADKVTTAKALLQQLLGSDRAHLRWPGNERDDLDRLVDALSRLASLDDLEPRPSHSTFVRALEAELDVSRGRTTPYGTGVVHGPLSNAVGQDLDAVFVVGMIEGLCPTHRRDEALLPEAARLAAGGELTTPDEQMAGQHRALLAALSAAPEGQRTLLMPRGDLRSHRHGLPSRWLLHSATALAGTPVYSTEFADLGAPIVDIVPSFSASVTMGARAVSLGERDLAAVAALVADGGDAFFHPALGSAARAITMQRARRSQRFTEFDGNLSTVEMRSPTIEPRPLTATRLESWATCGFKYFLEFELGLAPEDDPEQIVTTSAVDRGTVLHKILERFIGEAIAEGPPSPSTPWSAAQRRRMLEIADECFDELQQQGRTGRELTWRLERVRMQAALQRFLDDDDAERAAYGSTPVAAELVFGDEDTPVSVELDDGRCIQVRGKADRVDRTTDGHRVFDYKSGRGAKYLKIDADPVQSGTILQLGLYSEAVRQRLGGDHVDARFWLFESNEKDRLPGYLWTGDEQQRFRAVLTAIVEGIESGVFPQVPGPWETRFNTYQNCTYCVFTNLCPVARGDYAQAHDGDPLLDVRRRLQMPVAEPEPEAGGDGEAVAG